MQHNDMIEINIMNGRWFRKPTTEKAIRRSPRILPTHILSLSSRSESSEKLPSNGIESICSTIHWPMSLISGGALATPMYAMSAAQS
ncbi:MAG: hypothetical protein DMG11_04070 [Acidobacteria bacterium]|nr:MAG: hypothetical protein DMG11_04070 [Acidobacteriota bacterium]